MGSGSGCIGCRSFGTLSARSTMRATSWWPSGVVVQAVVVEEAHVLHLFERPLVGDDAVVPVGDRADVLVVDRDLAADAAEHRREVRVDAGEHHERRAVCDSRTTASSNSCAMASGSVPGRITSLPPAEKVMRSGLRAIAGSICVVDDLPDELSAHREVRVGEVVDLLRQHLGDAVGPAAVSARRGRARGRRCPR